MKIRRRKSGCFMRNVWTFTKSVCGFFLSFAVTSVLLFLSLIIKLPATTCHYKTQTFDKRYFLLLLWQGHGHARLLYSFSSFDQRIRKSSLHIWREVPFTQHKETGRRKRTAEEDSDTNDTTFQSKWHKVATSPLKKITGQWDRYSPETVSFVLY